MKNTLYQLKDLSDILGKLEHKILEAIISLGITSIKKSNDKVLGKNYYSEEHLDFLKYYFKDNFNGKMVNPPKVSFTYKQDDLDMLDIAMCQALTNDNTCYILRNPKEQVEIILTQNNQLISTHFLSLNECVYIKSVYPQLPFSEYKIRTKIYQ